MGALRTASHAYLTRALGRPKWSSQVYPPTTKILGLEGEAVSRAAFMLFRGADRLESRVGAPSAQPSSINLLTTLITMKPSEALIESIKRALRAQGLSYAQLASRIGCSEASVKRMFAKKNFDLARLDRIIEILDLELEELLTEATRRPASLEALTREQEAAIVADPVLFTVAVCVLHQLTLDQITAIYRITPAAAIRCLLSLDRMGFLTLHPNNIYRLRLSRTFRWLNDGPIMRQFREHAGHFLDHPFDGPGETLRVINVRLSNDRRLALLRRIEDLARDYADAHTAVSALPLGKRHPMSLLLAVRSWEPRFMRSLRRIDDAGLAAWLKSDAASLSPVKPSRLARNRLMPQTGSLNGGG